MRTHPKITTNIPTLREPFTHMMPRIVNDDVGSDIIPTHVGNGTVYRSYRTIGNAQQPIFMVSGKYTTGAKLAYENAPSLTRNKSGQSETDVPTSPTPTSNDPDTMIATKKYVDSNVVVYPEYKEGILLATVYVGTEPNKKSYKIYTPKQTVTVTFVDWDTTVLKTETVIIGGSATAPADPSRDYYKFAGWDKDFTNVKEDLIVTAQYDGIYTVTFVDYYDGSESIVAQYTFTTGTTQNVASIAPAMSRANVDFSVWTEDTGTTWKAATTVSHVTVLYATWSCKSTFMVNGSQYNQQTSYIGPKGQSTINKVTTPSDPSISGWAFKGWSPSSIVTYPKTHKTYTATLKHLDTLILEGAYTKLSSLALTNLTLDGANYTVPVGASITVKSATFKCYHSDTPDHKWTVAVNLAITGSSDTVASQIMHPSKKTTSADTGTTYTLSGNDSLWLSAQTAPTTFTEDRAYWVSAKTGTWSSKIGGQYNSNYEWLNNGSVVYTAAEAKAKYDAGYAVGYYDATNNYVTGIPDGIVATNISSAAKAYTQYKVVISDTSSCNVKRGGSVYVVLEVEY